MKLKRFVAPDSSKAMRKIKEAFGDDAVILSSHTVKDGVEIVAAIDYDENVISESLAHQDPGTFQLYFDEPSNTKQSANTHTDVLPTYKPNKGKSEIQMIKNEVQQLRELIENQLSGFAWQHLTHYQPTQMMLIKRLTNLGLDINLTEKLVKQVDSGIEIKSAWHSLLSDIFNMIERPTNQLLSSDGYYAFIGPTGVGKTTTIAKLAARFCLTHGAENLGLITLDSYRIAAVEQIITYGKILGVEVSVAQNLQTLQTAVNKLSDKKVILIDTAGMNPSDKRVGVLFAMFKQLSVPINPLVILSASSQYHVLEKLYQQYKAYNFKECIITKVDEAEEIGAALSLIINRKLTLNYLTNGQRVPEDLLEATNQNLIKELIQTKDSSSTDVNMNKMIAELSGSNFYV